MTHEDAHSVAGAAGTTGQMTREEIIAFFGRWQDAIDNLDAAALAAHYAENCIVESRTAGTVTGREAVEKLFRAWFNAFRDLKVTTDELVIDGDRAALFFSVHGTDVGGFLGLPATGKSFRVPIVFISEFRGREIARERHIYDFTGLLVQIGMLKAKPV
jgi:steroid delta-isomerase-like uncharacterized protein